MWLEVGGIFRVPFDSTAKVALKLDHSVVVELLIVPAHRWRKRHFAGQPPE
jgi:hypothetical protein